MARQQDKQLSRRVFVLIGRDPMTKTPRVVWEHELPILDAVFGEGSVEPAPAASLDEGFSKKASTDLKPFNKTQNDFTKPSESQGIGFVFPGDPRAEFARLIEVYGRHHEQNISYAEFCYGRFNEGRFEKIVGKPELEDMPEQQLRAIIREHGFIPAVSYDADNSEKEAVSKKVSELLVAPKEQLVKIAREVGVEA